MSKKSIKGTKTEQNLVNAYVSESTAYSRYMFYASQAEKEKYFPISEVFKETADNELRHAKVFFKHLEGGQVDCNVTVDAGVEQYKKSAAVARKEGFDEIAEHFESIAAIEEHHRQRFETYLKQVKEGTVWKRDHPIKWECLVCGYIFEGKEPPKECPACDHPQCHYKGLDID